MRAEVPGITPTAVGERLRLTCAALGLSQQEFGRRAGIGKQAMNNIFRGRNYPTWANTVALADAHNLTLEWIMVGSFRGMRVELVEAIRKVIEGEKAAQKERPRRRAASAG